MKIETQVKSVLSLCPAETLEDPNAFEAFIAQFVPVLANWQDKSGAKIGPEKAREAFINARNKARQKRVNEAAEAANKARQKRLEALAAKLQKLGIPPEWAEVFEEIRQNGGALEIRENGTLCLKVPKTKTTRGRVAADEYSGWLDFEGNPIMGSLTEWAEENLSEAQKSLGTNTKGKLYSGKKLAAKLGLKADPKGRRKA